MTTTRRHSRAPRPRAWPRPTGSPGEPWDAEHRAGPSPDRTSLTSHSGEAPQLRRRLLFFDSRLLGEFVGRFDVSLEILLELRLRHDQRLRAHLVELLHHTRV